MKRTLAVAVDPEGFKRHREQEDIPGIPHAFILWNGIILWHGHPASKLQYEVYNAVSDIDPTSRLVEAAARGDIYAVKASLERGADPNREVVVAHGKQRGLLHARPIIYFPGFMVGGGEDELTGVQGRENRIVYRPDGKGALFPLRPCRTKHVKGIRSLPPIEGGLHSSHQAGTPAAFGIFQPAAP